MTSCNQLVLSSDGIYEHHLLKKKSAVNALGTYPSGVRLQQQNAVQFQLLLNRGIDGKMMLDDDSGDMEEGKRYQRD